MDGMRSIAYIMEAVGMGESNVTISAVELNSGEWTGLGVLEITSIPDISIINGRFSSIEQANAEYRKEILSLLAELYQTLRSRNMPDAAFEMVWLTHPVENQPYSAAIQLFLLVHCIAPTQKETINLAETLTKLCQGAFAMQRYDVAPVDAPYFFSALEPIQGRDALALVREESIENLQNQMLPQCYSYDLIPAADNELVRLVDVLTASPACAVFFQLIPTTFTGQERELLGKLSQMLDTLSKGVMDQGVGTVSFTAAQPQAELYRHYDNGKNGPLFQFHVDGSAPGLRLNIFGTGCFFLAFFFHSQFKLHRVAGCAYIGVVKGTELMIQIAHHNVRGVVRNRHDAVFRADCRHHNFRIAYVLVHHTDYDRCGDVIVCRNNVVLALWDVAERIFSVRIRSLRLLRNVVPADCDGCAMSPLQEIS